MRKEIALGDILDNPFQSRTTFDPADIASLAAEIEAEGFWNTVLQARPSKNGKVELVYGHRRLRALRKLQITSIAIEIVTLTDAEMALRGLEENLQRQGLSDLEKADAVKRAVQLERTARKEAGKPERGTIEIVAGRLGLNQRWVSDLCQMSTAIAATEREHIEAGYLTGKTALAAKQWGGSEYLKTLAQQGKQAAEDGSVPKPTHMTVGAMKKAVAQAPETVRERLKKDIVDGKVTTPGQAEQRARRLASARVRREKEPPQDLRVVIVGWTRTLRDWNKQLQDVIPYLDYVDEIQSIAEPFDRALADFGDTIQQALKRRK